MKIYKHVDIHPLAIEATMAQSHRPITRRIPMHSHKSATVKTFIQYQFMRIVLGVGLEVSVNEPGHQILLFHSYNNTDLTDVAQHVAKWQELNCNLTRLLSEHADMCNCLHVRRCFLFVPEKITSFRLQNMSSLFSTT